MATSYEAFAAAHVDITAGTRRRVVAATGALVRTAATVPAGSSQSRGESRAGSAAESHEAGADYEQSMFGSWREVVVLELPQDALLGERTSRDSAAASPAENSGVLPRDGGRDQSSPGAEKKLELSKNTESASKNRESEKELESVRMGIAGLTLLAQLLRQEEGHDGGAPDAHAAMRYMDEYFLPSVDHALSCVRLSAHAWEKSELNLFVADSSADSSAELFGAPEASFLQSSPHIVLRGGSRGATSGFFDDVQRRGHLGISQKKPGVVSGHLRRVVASEMRREVVRRQAVLAELLAVVTGAAGGAGGSDAGRPDVVVCLGDLLTGARRGVFLHLGSESGAHLLAPGRRVEDGVLEGEPGVLEEGFDTEEWTRARVYADTEDKVRRFFASLQRRSRPIFRAFPSSDGTAARSLFSSEGGALGGRGSEAGGDLGGASCDNACFFSGFFAKLVKVENNSAWFEESVCSAKKHVV